MPEECASSVPPADWADKFMPAPRGGKLLNLAGGNQREQVDRR